MINLLLHKLKEPGLRENKDQKKLYTSPKQYNVVLTTISLYAYFYHKTSLSSKHKSQGKNEEQIEKQPVKSLIAQQK